MNPRLSTLLRTGVAVLLVAVPLATFSSPATGDASEAATNAVADRQRLFTAGNQHTCGVLDSGGVQCWGNNDTGQLGNGTLASSTVPVVVQNLSSVVELSAGGSHTCARLNGGTVKCWGLNGSGQIGDGSTDDRSTPQQVIGVAGATRVISGGFHSCAIVIDGLVRCWGQDGMGQLGDEAPGDFSTEATEVSGIDAANPATALAAGEFHTCALLEVGEVECWGHNAFHQLGDGTTDDKDVATPVVGLPDEDGDDVLAITAGQSHTCALMNDDEHQIRCWGHNAYGQLGRVTTLDDNETPGDPADDFMSSSEPSGVVNFDDADILTAADPDPLENALSVSAGQYHNCALVTGGDVYCWGNNGRGQLGEDPNSLTTDRLENSTYALVDPALPPASAVTAGGFHSCALVGAGMRCWGYNFYGQLGGFRASSPSPVTVTALTGASVVAAGTDFACALVDTDIEDHPVCWGSNEDGRLGAGSAAPNSIMRLDVVGVGKSTALDAGNGHACALPFGSGTPRCWGDNDNGQLGNGTTTDSFVSVAVSGLTDATTIDAGGGLGTAERGHTCAVRSGGTVQCWGRNADGQLGDGTTTDRSTPVTVKVDEDPDDPDNPLVDLTGATQVSAGAFHSCAVAGGSVWCWGDNGSGRLGDNSNDERRTAVRVRTNDDDDDPDFLGGASVVAAGDAHTCALMSNGEVRCWGANGSGQLGDTTNSSTDIADDRVRSANPPPAIGVAVMSNADRLASGDNHACARRTDGGMVCWGSDSAGQLGFGGGSSTSGNYAFKAPTPSEAIPFVLSISASRNNTCAALIDTTVSCWGANTIAASGLNGGQLGDGIGQHSLAPVTVGDLPTIGTNHIPNPANDSVTTSPGATETIDVLANDTDADPADTLTIFSVGDPEHGSATIVGGMVEYEPDAGFCGDESFIYTVTDTLAEVPATISIDMNCPPTAAVDTVTVPEDVATVIAVRANDTDPDGDALTVTGVGSPAHGTASTDGVTVTYDPTDNYCGADTFTYDLSDGTHTVTGAVNVTISCGNDEPLAGDDIASTAEDTPVAISVLGNDTDPDAGTTLVVAGVGTPTHGSLAHDGTTITYTPAADYCGADSFTYRVSDGLLEGTGTVAVTVTPCGADSPQPRDDVATVVEDSTANPIDVRANDVDPDGTGLTVTAVADPPHGSAAVVGGSVEYTPDQHYCGADAFDYTVENSPGSAAVGTVEVQVTCVDDNPVAADDAANTPEDTSVHVHVVGNDVDVDGDVLSATLVTAPTNGTAVPAGVGAFTYVPDDDYCGGDTFTYQVSDGSGPTDEGTVVVTVACVNDVPDLAAVNDVTTPWGDQISRTLTAVDADASDTLTYTLVSGPGAVGQDPGDVLRKGMFTFTPTAAQIGDRVVTVRVSDGTVTDQTSFVVHVTKRDTLLVYNGATSGEFSDAASASATLTDAGSPLGGVPIAFALGTASATGTTSGLGQATAAVPITGAPGTRPVTASFAGNAAYRAATDSESFTVLKEQVLLDVTSRLAVTTGPSTNVVLSADVLEADTPYGGALGGSTVTFSEVGGTPLCTGAVSATGPGQGRATCTTSLTLGSRAVLGMFSSTSYTGNGDVGVVTVANTGAGFASGGGRVEAGDDFGFWAKPVRRSSPVGELVHAWVTGSTATVLDGSVGTLATSCTGGKTKTCGATLTGGGPVWSVNLSNGGAIDVGLASIQVDTRDLAEPVGTSVPADTYAVAVTGGGADRAKGTPAGQLSITLGNVRVTG